MTGNIKLVCEHTRPNGRCCAAEGHVTVEEWISSDMLEAEADALAEDIGWADHRTCPACRERIEANVAECGKADAERLERSIS